MLGQFLYQVHTEFLALLTHIVGPDRSLDLTDMSLVEQHHAETALSDTATDTQGQFVVQQLLVEIELFALLLSLDLQLAQQTLLIDADTHRRQFERTAQNRIPDQDITVQTRTTIFGNGAPVVIVWYLIFDISLEAWLGALISLVIIKAGFEMLKETLSKILGERVDAQLARDIKSTISEYEEVNGVYDLVMHNYGPDAYNGSVHIEVPDTLSADELDKLLRKIQVRIYKEHNVILTAIGVYSYNTKDPEAVDARKKVTEIVTNVEHVIQMHGFYLDKVEKTVRFDIVVSFDADDRSAVYKNVCEKIQKEYPDYTLQIAMDTDFSEPEA